ncbi:ExeM/NucH family extracellular endonuclease [Motilibacter aurantiacus]|uniref:ExeM/NucH family extracellular endonuclease n=1 Tax=Motilibacter aurantiacus TaxID=2714955 RepID=UPI00140A80B7|nr:ExeM/NucH family extracellular endonuclease [Motilibacter aurantiacus]NHC46118.1 ExeM/NucH family extracellular endonuclease [Motilibacter aurantiacus]
MPLRRTAGALALSALLLALPALPASADTTASTLPFAQDWSDAGLIVANNDWSGVPSIIGYRGDSLASTNRDPQTVLADGASTPVNVVAQSTGANTAGGVHEVTAAGAIALQGSGTAQAPHIVIRVDTRGQSTVKVAYTLRDLDADDAGAQQVALQYRVGGSGSYVNVPAGYVADASQPPAADGTPWSRRVSVELPAAAAGQAVVDVRVITTDTTGSDSMTGVDDISVTGAGGEGPAAPAASCPAALAVPAGSGGSALLSATDADSVVSSVAITSAAVSGVSLTGVAPSAAAGQPATAALTVAASAAAGTYPVTVTFSTADAPAQTTACNVTVSVLEVTRISQVQGSGATTPMPGRTVAVEGVVTALKTAADVLAGFFVQEEAADVDGDPATSEGVYVFCGASCPTGLTAGDRAVAVGTVTEYFGLTQVDARSGAVSVRGSGLALPVPVDVALPAPVATTDRSAYESVEGMVARFPAELVVTEYFELARYGQIELAAGSRPYQFTHVSAPSVAGNAAYLAEQARTRIILDDDNDNENDQVTGAQSNEPYPYPSGGLSVTNRFRGGDSITGLTGVLDYSFNGTTGTDAWRVRPLAGVDYTFTPQNPRPATAPQVGGRLTVAGFNVLNYFTTVDTTPSSNSGPCGPLGNQDCRGADSEAERQRQLAKVVEAISGISPDVAGLNEIQNDPGRSLADIVNALNATLGAGTYAGLETGSIGGDAIKVAMIYKPAVVEPVGAHKVLTSAIDPRFVDTANRPALIQTFRERSSGEKLTIAANHFKSKGSACAGDPDLGDGQGNCPVTRRNAARALIDYLATDPTGSGDPDVLVIGDLNSYKQEWTIQEFEAKGYVDLAERFAGPDAYSYVFDGQLGYLDHALANSSLNRQVTGAAEWHINADEPPLLDYNDSVLDAGESSFERKSDARPLYAADPFRASDHDPVVVGLDLAPALAYVPALTAGVNQTFSATLGRLPFAVSSTAGLAATVEWGDGSTSAATLAGPASSLGVLASHRYTAAGSYPVLVRVTRNGATVASAATTVTVS